MPKSGNPTEKNTNKNLVRNFPHPTGNLSAQLAFKISALASALLYVAGWMSTLGLDSDELILPSIDQKDASPALWDSFPTSGTENVNPSQQIDFASKGYCVAPTLASLCLSCLFANTLTGSGKIHPASLSLPLSHCFDLPSSLSGH